MTISPADVHSRVEDEDEERGEVVEEIREKKKEKMIRKMKEIEKEIEIGERVKNIKEGKVRRKGSKERVGIGRKIRGRRYR